MTPEGRQTHFAKHRLTVTVLRVPQAKLFGTPRLSTSGGQPTIPHRHGLLSLSDRPGCPLATVLQQLAQLRKNLLLVPLGERRGTAILGFRN